MSRTNLAAIIGNQHAARRAIALVLGAAFTASASSPISAAGTGVMPRAAAVPSAVGNAASACHTCGCYGSGASCQLQTCSRSRESAVPHGVPCCGGASNVGCTDLAEVCGSRSASDGAARTKSGGWRTAAHDLGASRDANHRSAITTANLPSGAADANGLAADGWLRSGLAEILSRLIAAHRWPIRPDHGRVFVVLPTGHRD